MAVLHHKGREGKARPWQIVGIVAVLLLALLLLGYGNLNSWQAAPAIMAQVYFEGEYKIADGPWEPVVPGEHIPATRGDVVLRGDFHMLAPDGTYVGLYTGDMPLAFYLNHINITFYVEGLEPFATDAEAAEYGIAGCGEGWRDVSYVKEGAAPIEIHIHNPHGFGNERAIDEMLANVAFWTGMDFEKSILEKSETQRNAGISLMIVAAMILGIALASRLIKIKNSQLFALLGFVVLFAGAYFAYSARGVSFWKDSVVSNTTILGCTMMLYMLFLNLTLVYFMSTTKKVARVAMILLSAVNGLCFALPVVTGIRFYDTWGLWVLGQLGANGCLLCCLVIEYIRLRGPKRWIFIGGALALVAFGLDVAMTALGTWAGGIASGYVFLGSLAAVTVVLLRTIPRGIKAAAKAEELETEKVALNAQLAETRIATMMSQIRPHFIYNTLGSIEQLCELDPVKAGELVHNFAKYLRGNFGELDNPRPIRMSQEMEHVRYYISIEKVRFPDMTFLFDMNSEDFCLPALTIQPIVENAVKHGLMKRERGGTIRVESYETKDSYCVSVEDDGMGFNTAVLMEDRAHMGIRNIRERLKAMVGGTLEIESTHGVGTKVLITIPKEVRK